MNMTKNLPSISMTWPYLPPPPTPLSWSVFHRFSEDLCLSGLLYSAQSKSCNPYSIDEIHYLISVFMWVGVFSFGFQIINLLNRFTSSLNRREG